MATGVDGVCRAEELDHSRLIPAPQANQKSSGANGVVTGLTEVLLAAWPTWPSSF
jgi:hypothetical protein